MGRPGAGRLQRLHPQAKATDTVDWDIMEMGAPFEGDWAGGGRLDPMPDWVAEQIDMADYVDYLKPPIGTWDDVTYRISIDGDTHTLAYRTDYYDNEEFAEAWAGRGSTPTEVSGHRRRRGRPSTTIQVPGRQDRPADRASMRTASSTR